MKYENKNGHRATDRHAALAVLCDLFMGIIFLLSNP